MTSLLTTWLDLEGEAAVVRVVGEVDTVTVGAFSETLELAASMVIPPSPLHLDLGRVTFFGSAGLAALADARDRFEGWNITLSVTTVSTIVARVLAVTRLD
jgi:anti-anti-sigma factor